MRFVATLAFALLPGAAVALDSCICVTCLTMGHENFRAVSGAMAPTVPAGACITMTPGNTMAVARGDLVFFRGQFSDSVIFFRTIGLPGDRVAMADGRVVLNGTTLLHDGAAVWDGDPGLVPDCGLFPADAKECRAIVLTESLPEGPAWRVLNAQEGVVGDNMAEVTVPPEHLFLLGDNRDNAFDSRFALLTGGPGMIPMADVIGIRRWTTDDQ
jgi:signal peptidase I